MSICCVLHRELQTLAGVLKRIESRDGHMISLTTVQGSTKGQMLLHPVMLLRRTELTIMIEKDLGERISLKSVVSKSKLT